MRDGLLRRLAGGFPRWIEPGLDVPLRCLKAVWDLDLAPLEPMANPCQKSLLRAADENGLAAESDQWLDRAPAREFFVEPLAPLRQDRKAEPHGEAVQNEAGRVGTEDRAPSLGVASRARQCEFF